MGEGQQKQGVMCMLTESQLKALIRGERISSRHPYDTADEQAFANYLQFIQAEMARSGIQCRVSENHFGDSYASYVQLLCYEHEHQIVVGREETINGLHVLISFLAPIVLIGQGEEITLYGDDGELEGGSYSILSEPSELVLPTTSLKQLAQKMERLFMKHHFTILHKEDVEKPLPFKAKIPTIFRRPRGYLIWDAIFYWKI